MSKSLKLEGTSDDLLKLLFGFMSSLDTPLVHISDLVQNSIDANADYIKIEIIKKSGKTEKVIVADNGYGFLQSFENYAKHIGDSLKKKADIYLDKREKGELGGEFGIGMQGFRSIASELDVISLTTSSLNIVRDRDGKIIDDPDFPKMHKCRRMRFFKDKLDIIIDEEGDFNDIRTANGVTYILSGLISTAEKDFKVSHIISYLSNAKRAYLLKNKKLKIVVADEITTEKVIPFTYKGERLLHKIILPNQDKDLSKRGFGDVFAELYYHIPKKGSKIVVTIKGEPIYFDLCQKIEGFDRHPWNSGMIEGSIEYERLSRQPGRIEIQRDSFYDAFIDMLKILEKEIDIKVKELERDYQTKQDEKLLNKLEDVFGKIRKEIDLDILGSSGTKIKGPLAKIQLFPDKENVEAYGQRILYVKAYDEEDNELTEKDNIEFAWKVTGKLGTISSYGDRAVFDAGNTLGITEVLVTAKDKISLKELLGNIEIVIIHPTNAGPLYKVKIVPGVITVPVNKERIFNAIAEDMHGNTISNIKYFWRIVYDTSEGSKINNDSRESIVFTAGKRIGQVKIHLKATKGKISKEDIALIDVKETKKIGPKSKKPVGLPIPQKVSALEYPMWHSRLDDKQKVLYYNTAHHDYIDVQNDATKRQRYIANLYAKELTLLKYKSLGIEHFSEKLIEVMSKLDKYWKL